jgi:hypothetical protein
MPSHSKKQAALFRAVANNPEFAKQVGIPQEVAREFLAADKKRAGQKAAKPVRKGK